MAPKVKLFADFLVSKGLKLTGERQKIVDEIFRIPRHFEPEELLIELRGRQLKASRATIYRTLELLREAGLIRKVCMGSGRFSYEPVTEDAKHDHLICVRCGKVVCFIDPEAEAAKKRIGAEKGFELTGQCFQLFGYCPACRS